MLVYSNGTFVSVIFISFVTSCLGLQEEEEPPPGHPMSFHMGISHSRYCALWDVKLLPNQSSTLCWSLDIQVSADLLASDFILVLRTAVVA